MTTSKETFKSRDEILAEVAEEIGVTSGEYVTTRLINEAIAEKEAIGHDATARWLRYARDYLFPPGEKNKYGKCFPGRK